MGRRKLEMKRIEDKSSRQVAFSKRRAGLMKKARHLSVLCDVDVGVVIFSVRGKLYEFCSRSSLGEILRRYERCILEPDAEVATGAYVAKENNTQSASFRTSGELLEMVQKKENPLIFVYLSNVFGEHTVLNSNILSHRYAEEQCLEQLNVPDLLQLEEDLFAALMQTRIRKTQLMMEYVQSLHEKEEVLCKENKEMEQKVAGMKNGANINKAPDLNVPAASQMNCAPKRVTLPLFTK